MNDETKPRTQHSPAPWKIALNTEELYPELGRQFISIYSSEGRVCSLEDRPGLPNSHLIMAAPELLAALKRAQAIIGSELGTYGREVAAEFQVLIDEAEGIKKMIPKHIQEDLAKLSPEKRAAAHAMVQGIDEAFNQASSDLDTQIEIEERLRKSGLHHIQALELLEVMKALPIGVIQSYAGRIWVKTPFNTVVEAQLYVNHLQARLIEKASIKDEELIHKLRLRLKLLLEESETVKLGFFGLIKLAFSRLFNRSLK